MDRLKRWFPVLAILLLVLIMTFPLFAVAFEWNISGSDIFSATATLATGVFALYAAYITIINAQETHNAQIKILSERDNIQDFYKFQSDINEKIERLIDFTNEHTSGKIRFRNSHSVLFTINKTQENYKPKLHLENIRIIIEKSNDISKNIGKFLNSKENNNIKETLKSLQETTDLINYLGGILVDIAPIHYGILEYEGETFKILDLEIDDYYSIVKTHKHIVLLILRESLIYEQELNDQYEKIVEITKNMLAPFEVDYEKDEIEKTLDNMTNTN